MIARKGRSLTVVPALITSLQLLAPAVAQCAPQAQPGAGLPGVEGGQLRSLLMWDADGGGPAPELLVLAGTFHSAGDVTANRIVAYNPQSLAWTPLGTGLDGTVTCLAALPNGDLVAGGTFTTAGGATVNRIARWDGAAWQPLGTGMDNDVFALAVLPGGDLVAGGFFTTAGGTPASRIARWDGVAWSQFGLGADDSVLVLRTLPNGDLIAGGGFTSMDGTAASRLARWNGVAWGPIGVTGCNDFVRAIVHCPNGDLIVGGAFTSVDGAPVSRVARWNGSAWSPLGVDGCNDQVYALAATTNGDVVVGGVFTSIDGIPILRLARWDGSAWSSVGGGVATNAPGVHVVYSLAMAASGDLFCGGAFPNVGTAPVRAWQVARWDGANWTGLGSGINESVHAVVALPNGDAIVGGRFHSIGDVPIQSVARWNGSQWSPLGAGITGTVSLLRALENGDLLAAGLFTEAGGSPANNIARWDGANWSPLGNGIDGGINPQVRAMVAMPNGDIVVGGQFSAASGVTAMNVARWDGVAWSPLGSGLNGLCTALVALPNGEVVAAGFFTSAGGAFAQRCARWDGSAWIPMHLTEFPSSLALDRDGDILIGVNTGVREWDGASWFQVGPTLSSTAVAMAVLPDGDLVIGGVFSGFVPGQIAGVLRWDGSSWSSFANVLSPTGIVGGVRALTWSPAGELLAGGDFRTIDNMPSYAFARWTTPCEATAVPFGTACSSSGGSNSLTASTKPWVDATFRASGTGLPTAAIALALTSLTAFPQGTVPLTLAFPSPPGCDLLVAPDILGAYVTTTGTVESTLVLPNVPPLVGVTFFHQLLPFEIDSFGALGAPTATNALQLTAGQF